MYKKYLSLLIERVTLYICSINLLSVINYFILEFHERKLSYLLYSVKLTIKKTLVLVSSLFFIELNLSMC